MNEVPGACHCGNVAFRFSTALPLPDLELRACGCGYCSRFGGIYASDPRGELSVSVNGGVLKYRLGTETADFWICPRCGIMLLVAGRIDDRDIAVINVRCSDAFTAYLSTAKPVSFDGETRDGRLERRRRTWTPFLTGTNPARSCIANGRPG